MMFDPTGANIDYIYKFWPDAQWSDDVQEILTKYVDAKKEAQKIKEEKEKDLPSSDDFMFKTKPFDHQKRAFYLSRDKELCFTYGARHWQNKKLLLIVLHICMLMVLLIAWLLLHLMVFIETGYQQKC